MVGVSSISEGDCLADCLGCLGIDVDGEHDEYTCGALSYDTSLPVCFEM